MAHYRHAKVAPFQEITLAQLVLVIALVVVASVGIKHVATSSASSDVELASGDLPFESCEAKVPFLGKVFGRECQLQAQLKGIE